MSFLDKLKPKRIYRVTVVVAFKNEDRFTEEVTVKEKSKKRAEKYAMYLVAQNSKYRVVKSNQVKKHG